VDLDGHTASSGSFKLTFYINGLVVLLGESHALRRPFEVGAEAQLFAAPVDL
jgi:hypothetical protein